jgi:hypothetical protein
MEPQNFRIVGNRGTFRPAGIMSLYEAVNEIDEGLVFARQRGLKKLLVDTRALYGFDPPSVIERYWFIRRWARSVAAAVRVAIVARSELIDPEKFGTTVARNNGMASDVFLSEPKAAAWLALPSVRASREFRVGTDTVWQTGNL